MPPKPHYNELLVTLEKYMASLNEHVVALSNLQILVIQIQSKANDYDEIKRRNEGLERMVQIQEAKIEQLMMFNKLGNLRSSEASDIKK
jgi:hypothetical protein